MGNQSVKGIETANIVEIIDHHRLDSVKTELPIFIDAEPVGSTCTIVFRKYVQEGITPDTASAKMLLAGIVSDTLILRSPTTTPVDVTSANRLAEIIGEDLKEFGLRMFSCMEGLKPRAQRGCGVGFQDIQRKESEDRHRPVRMYYIGRCGGLQG